MVIAANALVVMLLLFLHSCGGKISMSSFNNPNGPLMLSSCTSFVNVPENLDYVCSPLALSEGEVIWSLVDNSCSSWLSINTITGTMNQTSPLLSGESCSYRIKMNDLKGSTISNLQVVNGVAPLIVGFQTDHISGIEGDLKTFKVELTGGVVPYDLNVPFLFDGDASFGVDFDLQGVSTFTIPAYATESTTYDFDVLVDGAGESEEMAVVTLMSKKLNSSAKRDLKVSINDTTFTATVVSISSGRDQVFALLSDGTLRCFGSGGNGQLGLGGTLVALTPLGFGVDSDWAQASAGGVHTCAIKTGGTLYCWGYDYYGQLGIGVGSGNHFTPTQVGVDTNWLQVDTGYGHTCAIKTDNSLYCWGDDDYGTVGNGGVTGDQISPYRVGTDNDWQQVTAGWRMTCAVKTDGSLYCWGNTQPENFTSPNRVGVDNDWSQVTVGSTFTCAVKTDNSLYCWGQDVSGQLGNGEITGTQASPYRVGVDNNWFQVSANSESNAHACAVKTDRTLYCWGSDAYGQLGNGKVSTNQVSPYQVGVDTDWLQVTTGNYFTCALKTNGESYCWGKNHDQFGPGVKTYDQSTPNQVGSDTNWSQVIVGGNSTCAIKTDGTLFCFGGDEYGQLGNGAVTGEQSTPYNVGADTDWSQVDIGSQHICGIKADGTLYCWGNDTGEQLGNGAILGSQTRPFLIGVDSDWSQVTAGSSYTCAVKIDRTLYCWGRDSNDVLGNGADGDQSTPQQIGAESDWEQVAINSFHSCAVKTDGTLYCWGGDIWGMLGNGVGGNQSTPGQVGGDTNWQQVSAGFNHTCAVKTDGTLYCWGNDYSGQLGNGGITGVQQDPVQVGGDTNWQQVSAGSYYSCAVKTDRSLYCWGRAFYGQLGNGTFTGDRTSPTRVGVDTDWLEVTARTSHTCAIKTDGTIYCFGRNYYGQVTWKQRNDVPRKVINLSK